MRPPPAPPTPTEQKILRLLKWCIGLLALGVLSLGTMHNDLRRLENRVGSSPIHMAPPPVSVPTARNIADELRKAIGGPPFSVEKKGASQHGTNVTKLTFHVMFKTDFVYDPRVTAADGIKVTLKPFHQNDQRTIYSVDCEAKALPETWDFTVEATTAFGTNPKRVYKVSRDPANPSYESIKIE